MHDCQVALMDGYEVAFIDGPFWFAMCHNLKPSIPKTLLKPLENH